MDCIPPASSVHGILQGRILEWVAFPFSRGSSRPRDWTWVSCVSCIGRWMLYYCTTLEAPFCFEEDGKRDERFSGCFFFNIVRLPLGFPGSSADKESTCSAGGPGSIPESGRSPGEGIGYPLQYSWVSLVAQMVKKSTCNAGDLGSFPGSGRSPGGEHGNPLQYSCLENPHGQRRLEGYSPWVTKTRTWLSD